MKMLSDYLSKLKLKNFMDTIGVDDDSLVNPEGQLFWASICARAAWRSFSTNYMVLPVAVEDEHMEKVNKQQWLPLMSPASNVGFYPNDDETFKLCFDRTDPQELIADPQTAEILARSYDLLEQCEESVWDLPQPVMSAAHKLRTAINKQAQASMGGNG